MKAGEEEGRIEVWRSLTSFGFGALSVSPPLNLPVQAPNLFGKSH